MKILKRKNIYRLIALGVVFLGLGLLLIRYGNDLAIAFESSKESISEGTPENGSLKYGKRLPSKGKNFRAYSYLGASLGRNSVHDKVRDVILMSYRSLSETHPNLSFIYGECGWPSGGPFKPHKTHQNGLSVDFMVPVKNASGPARMSTHAFNKYGYSLEFDDQGQCQSQKCEIDFTAMAAHLLALQSVAQERGMVIRRVIFAPNLQPHLFKTEDGAQARKLLSFSDKSSWVKHDEHYHVDFENPDLEEN